MILKIAAGHTPGHQVLYVKLAKTGGVVLSGDLYHYPQERTMNRLPTFEFNEEQTRAARKAVDAFLTRTGAQLWIQHDFTAHAKLKMAPPITNSAHLWSRRDVDRICRGLERPAPRGARRLSDTRSARATRDAQA